MKHLKNWLFKTSIQSLGLAENDAVVAASKAESLLDLTGHRHLGAIAGKPKILAEDPNAAGAVIHLEDPVSKTTEGPGGLTGDGNVFAGKTAGRAIDIGNGNVCGTSHHAQSQEHERSRQQDSVVTPNHRSSVNGR
jgi:hypothetical protein